MVKVPPNSRLPLVVTVPERVMPLTVPVPPTDLTVPSASLNAIKLLELK